MYTELISRYFGQEASPILEAEDDIADTWMDYAVADRASRIAAFSKEIEDLKPWLPKTVEQIRPLVYDVFLVKSPQLKYHGEKPRGFVRVVNKLIDPDMPSSDENLFTYFSHEPVHQDIWATSSKFEKFPAKLREIYVSKFDGFCNTGLAGGPKPFFTMSLLSDEIEEYEEYPWYDDFLANNDPKDFIEIFSSGGGGYIYLDLSKPSDSEGNLRCLQLFNDHDEPLEMDMPFWDLLDSWTEISLGG